MTTSSTGLSSSPRHTKQTVEKVEKGTSIEDDCPEAAASTATTGKGPMPAILKASWEAKNFKLLTIGAALQILAKVIANVQKSIG